MTNLRIALLQIDDQGSLQGNLEHGLAALEYAAGRGADIALLPELWSHGYRFFEAGDAAGQARWRASVRRRAPRAPRRGFAEKRARPRTHSRVER